MVADEAISAGAVLRMSITGEAGMTPGRVVNANAGNETDAEAMGIAVTAAAAQGNSLSVATGGEVSILFGAAPASADNGKTVYLSTSDGLGTLTPPNTTGDTVVRLGRLKGGNGADTTPTVVLNMEILILLG